ncbi:hypothetical protein LINPERPRIM_LOCUS38365 [Linum perenne]
MGGLIRRPRTRRHAFQSRSHHCTCGEMATRNTYLPYVGRGVHGDSTRC